MILKILILIFVFSGVAGGYFLLYGRRERGARIGSRRPFRLRDLKVNLIPLLRTKPTPTLKTISLLIMAILGLGLTKNLFFIFFFALIGYFLPNFLSRYLQGKRLEEFDNQLVDSLTTIANSLRAGLSFPQALETIAREASPPLSEEFSQVNREISLGTDTEEALLELTRRVPSRELHLAVTAINIAQEAGGNLAEVLGQLSSTMRQREMLQGKIKTLTAEGRLSGIVVGIMPILLGLAIHAIEPDLMKPMFHTLPGNIMLGVIVILLFLGAVVIKKIVTIDI
ncbi:type II secretion system F family protein [bacterium]|nr:type II secretion system F family protein [bacterium]